MVETNLKLAQITIRNVKITDGKIVLDDSLDNWLEIQNAIEEHSMFTAFVRVMLDIRQLVSSGNVFPSVPNRTLVLADGSTDLNASNAAVVINYLTSK